jgi:hypothetical protein
LASRPAGPLRFQVQLPAALQSLHLGANFDRCMDQAPWDAKLMVVMSPVDQQLICFNEGGLKI